MTETQKSKIIYLVQDCIDEMFCQVLDSVDAQTGDETPDFKLKYTQLVDQVIELAIEHAKNNI